MNLFASPEAAAARELMERGDEDNKENKENYNYTGIDLPLADSNLNNKTKTPNLKDLVDTYYSPNVQAKTSSRGRWRRASICASMCASLEKKLQEKTPMRISTPLPRAPSTKSRPSSVKCSSDKSQQNTEKHGLLPRVSFQDQIDADVEERKADGQKDSNVLNELKYKPQPPLSPRKNPEEHRTLDSRDNTRTESPANDSDSDSSSDDDSSCDDAMSLSIKSCPIDETEQNIIRSRTRFGRRFSLPGNITSLPRQFCPTPPSLADFQKTISPRSSQQNSRTNSPRSDRKCNGRNGSLTENLQTNRALINGLLKQRSSMISSLKSSDSCSVKSEDFEENEFSGPIPARGGNRFSNRRASLDVASLALFNQSRLIQDICNARKDFADSESSGQRPVSGNRMFARRASLDASALVQFNQTRTADDAGSATSEDQSEDGPGQSYARGSRLLNRRASLDVASLTQFNQSRNAKSETSSFKIRPRKATSLESLLCERRLPSPILEGSEECSDTESARNINIRSSSKESNCYNDCPPISNKYHDNDEYDKRSRKLHSGSATSFANAQFRNDDASSVRSEDASSIRDMQIMKNYQMQKLVALKRSEMRLIRSDADIVKDVEDEIQQRVSRRKQQLINEQGGGNTFKRFHNNLNRNSAGHKLKMALEDLNRKRTTRELIEIADVKNHETVLQEIALAEKVKNFIRKN